MSSIDRVEELGTDMIKLLGERISIVQVLGHYLELKRNLGMNESEIRSYQNGRLRRIVSHAYQTVPFYKELFDKHKVDPDSIESVSDLNKLPIINKNILRKVPFDRKVSRAFIKKPLEKYLTGGSTGEPFTFYLSKDGRIGGWHIGLEYCPCMATMFSIRAGLWRECLAE